MNWRDEVASLPALKPPFVELSAATTALVIVDMQYLDAHRGHGFGVTLRQSHPEVWAYYFGRIEELVLPNTVRLLSFFRERGLRVLFVRLGSQLPGGGDMLPSRRPAATPALAGTMHYIGSFEHQILPELRPVEGELVLDKTSRGAFNSTAIERTLLNLGVRTLVLAGVSTSSCVETTARDAVDRGFQAILVEDALAELDEASHVATLRQFEVRWGDVLTCDETLARLRDLP